MKNLKTVWTDKASCEMPLAQYPRPMMVRGTWISLNGMWNYLITDKRIQPYQFYETEDFPFDGEIRVPFSPEAPLSGVRRQVMPEDTLWYARNIILPEGFFDDKKQNLLLHFGAVDQICTVYINGIFAGFHKGGYLPFTVDITPWAFREKVIRILIAVKDFSDTSYHSRGKQKLNSGGMFYTATSGIWQTIWMEAVPKDYIKNLRITPDFDDSFIHIRACIYSGQKPAGEDSGINPDVTSIGCEIYEPVMLGPEGVSAACCKTLIKELSLQPGMEEAVALPHRQPWTPENPWLYPVRLTFGYDEVYTYFAMRKCNVQKDRDGYQRFFLNNKPYFQSGVLDQGYWPDGLYTAPTDEAMIYDIRTMKGLGFNMLRKHVKIEADRWYFHCDRLGMLVWQDMVNGGTSYHHWFVTYLATPLHLMDFPVKDTHPYLLSRKDFDGRQEHIDEVRATIKALYNHPCIVCWVPFNEGWGQYSTHKMTDMIKRLDPYRLINSACGWFDQKCGDIKGLHYYFFSLHVPRDPRVLALSEFGGYSWRIPGHSACRETYGYKVFNSRDELTQGFEKLMKDTVLPSVKKGISASIYTQVSDIEEEVNGILTYDRKITKLHPLVVQKWNAKLKASFRKK